MGRAGGGKRKWERVTGGGRRWWGVTKKGKSESFVFTHTESLPEKRETT